MERLGRRLAQRGIAWAVVILSLTFTAVAGWGAWMVDHDDDLLAFLPKDDPDVATFHEINQRFGSLDVALVGIEVADPLDPAFFSRFKGVTRALNENKSVAFALSLTNVEDFSPAEGGGIKSSLLVEKLPKEPAARARLFDQIMQKDHVVGNLISRNGHAVLLYAFAEHDTNPRTFAHTVRHIVETGLPDANVYWNGAPFVASYIYETTQEDLRNLTPWAVFAVILLVFLAFRDMLGAALALISTAMGIVWSMGVMGFLGIRYNVILSSMPVILFSVGSAYGIHVLTRYYQLAIDRPKDVALIETLRQIGPTVLIAGLTTVGGLLSFLVMDIAPMRMFGLFTGLGILASLVLALTFVPAVIVVLNLGPRPLGADRFTQTLLPAVRFAEQQRWAIRGGLVLLAIWGGYGAVSIDTRMDNSAFFNEGSVPARGDAFMAEHFGGSQFVQIHFRGDFADPHILREVERIADLVSLHPAVTHVMHVGQVVSIANAAMEGQRRIPDDAAKVKMLYTFLGGRKSMEQIMTPDRTEALVHVKLGSTDLDVVEASLLDIETLVKRETPDGLLVARLDTDARAEERLHAYIAGRVEAEARSRSLPFDTGSADKVRTILEAPVSLDGSRIAAGLTDFLNSEENIFELDDETVISAIATHVAEVSEPVNVERVEQALRRAVDGRQTLADEPIEDVVFDLAESLVTPLQELRRGLRAQQRAQTVVQKMKWTSTDGLEARLSNIVSASEAPTGAVEVSADVEEALMLSSQVNGLPVLHRGMSRSATKNQIWSLVLAMGLVVLILSWAFRSVKTGLLAATPTMLTLLVIYGAMGRIGVHLDIGTSMIASLIIGAGVDYAVHLVSACKTNPTKEGLTQAVRKTGPAIWTNATMVAVGFFLLTLGEARTLQNVGGLTSAAMFTAAMATFLTIPVLIDRRTAPVTVASRELKDKFWEG